MTAEQARIECSNLLQAFKLTDWLAVVCSDAALALTNGSALGRNGDPLQGLTVFRMHTIFLSETYCEIDRQAWELIEHEVAHALSGESECANNPLFDAAAKRIDAFYKAAEENRRRVTPKSRHTFAG